MEITEIHPLIIHFPIALLSVGYFFDVLAVIFKKDEFISVGWWNLCLGIVSSFFALLTGFIADWEYGHFENPFPVFDTHGSIQLFSVFLFSILFVWRWKLDKKLPEPQIKTIGYFIIGTCAVVSLFYGGHLGAVLSGRI